MEKNEFLFWFPESKTTINVVVSPLRVKDIAEQYLDRQGEILGSICVIKFAYNDEIIAFACYPTTSSKISFYTEDKSISVDVVDIVEP